jgi:hypothetical protein
LLHGLAGPLEGSAGPDYEAGAPGTTRPDS